MNQTLDQNVASPARSPTETTDIRTADGTITVKSRALFSDGDDRALHSLIERLFQSDAVHSVAFEREQATVAIGYDRSAMNVSSALRTFSTMLANSRSARGKRAHAGSLLRPYLDRLPGRVKLVERRRHREGELTGAALAGIDLAADTGTATHAPAAGGEPSDSSLESRIVLEDLIVEFDPALEGEGGAAAQGTSPETDVTRPWVGQVVVGGVRRMANLAAAGGCFVMSIVGVITPGIPTVPFVLATGYFLARSSPRLHQRFRNSRFFGTMISDYEDHGGLRWTTKFKMIVFTIGLMVVTVVIAGATLPLLIGVGLMGTIGIYILGRIPTVKGVPRAAEPATA
jgi:uncharacterized membrane protein YbaN (DUF454 family)